MQASGIVVNVSGQPVRFEIATLAGSSPLRYKVEPGKTVEIQPGYATPPEAPPGTAPRPSVIENLTCAKVLPVEDPRAREFITPEVRQEMADAVLLQPAPRKRKAAKKRRDEDESAGDDISDLDEVQE